MDARTFLGLQPSHNPYRWHLPVSLGISTGSGFLFGGSGLGAAIEAMEGTTGRPVVWATAQYLSYARPGTVMDIDVTVAVEGHQITQARAIGHVGNTEILTVNAALGVRPLETAGQWAQMPEGMPAPEDCPARPLRFQVEESINTRLDLRVAKLRDFSELDGTPGDGRTVMWARMPEVLDMSGAALAILGDYVPMGVSQALGLMAGGNSLDNTLRVARLVPTQWVMLDIRVHAVDHGFAHGLVHLWAQDGTLLATASQSCIVRFWKQPPALTAEVARLIFGTADLERVTEALSTWTRDELGASVDIVEHWHWSVGAVAVVALSDGRRVALKAFAPRWTADFLTAVVRVQTHLAARGLPCPVPLAGPFPLDAAVIVCAERYLEDPGQPHPLGERELVASATGLARLVTVAAELRPSAVAALANHPMRTPDGELYPEPHSPLFDFEATVEGAHWIDDLARDALAARDGDLSAPVVAHTDWSARNVRLWPDGVRAIYDADSLALVPESTAVGIAAATWSAFGEAGEQIAPSPEEAAAWAREYESAGRPLSASQRHAAGGAILHTLAYTARCEHALEVGHHELGRPRRARDRLERDGARYIERFEEACEARR